MRTLCLRLLVLGLAVLPSTATAGGISWTPAKLSASVPIGAVSTVPITFVSEIPLQDVGVWIAPKLSPYVSPVPAELTTVPAHTPITVTLVVDIPATSSARTLVGSIHLVGLASPGSSRRRGQANKRGTFARPLQVALSLVENITWAERFPARYPSPRGFTAATFDKARGEVVLFGGLVEGGVSGALDDTWVWDGVDWTQRFPQTHPPKMAFHAMAYDEVKAEVVLVGAPLPNGPDPPMETWTWDGTTWEQKAPAVRPPWRTSPALTYDALRGEVVLFGGASVNLLTDTWIWDGVNWTQRFPSVHPPTGYFSAMASDPVSGEVILFGGYPDFSDTWMWNGVTWSQRTPTTSPAGRSFHAMVPWGNRGVLLFGGDVFPLGQFFSDTWLWNGVDWVELSPSQSPSARAGHVMAFDENRGEGVLFGSTRPGAVLTDTWVIRDVP